MEVIRSLIDRLAFASDPHRLDTVAVAGSDFGADPLILDYVQRIDPSERADGMCERINRLMADLRGSPTAGRPASSPPPP